MDHLSCGINVWKKYVSIGKHNEGLFTFVSDFEVVYNLPLQAIIMTLLCLIQMSYCLKQSYFV